MKRGRNSFWRKETEGGEESQRWEIVKSGTLLKSGK